MKAVSALLLIFSLILLSACDAMGPDPEAQARHGVFPAVLHLDDEPSSTAEWRPVRLAVSGSSHAAEYDAAPARIIYTTANGPVARYVAMPWIQTVWLAPGSMVELRASVEKAQGPLTVSIYQEKSGRFVTRTAPNGTQVSVSTVVQ